MAKGIKKKKKVEKIYTYEEREAMDKPLKPLKINTNFENEKFKLP